MPSGRRREIPRPVAILRAWTRRFPQAWRQIDALRAARGTTVPDWPDWCYVPIGGTLAIAEAASPASASPLAVAHDAAMLAALAAWRMGQGIYRWHPALARAVADTPLDGPLPVDLLYRLPEWGVYHAIPADLLRVAGQPVIGVFAHLEWDANTQGAELRLVVDTGDDARLWPIPLPLAPGTIAGALDALVASAAQQVRGPVAHPGSTVLPLIRAAVGWTLYLAAEEPDIVGDGRRGNPEPVRTSRGLRVFAREAPRTWEVGWRLGAVVGAPRRPAGGEPRGGHHASPRPHLRGAHWHAYWAGPRDGPQTRRLRWLQPIAVGGDGARPAVIHDVHGKEADDA